jgi:hypothetical protein
MYGVIDEMLREPDTGAFGPTRSSAATSSTKESTPFAPESRCGSLLPALYLD